MKQAVLREPAAPVEVPARARSRAPGATSSRAGPRSPASWSCSASPRSPVFAPWITPQDPYDLAQLDIMDGNLPPGSASLTGGTYWLGTDDQGRDMLSGDHLRAAHELRRRRRRAR